MKTCAFSLIELLICICIAGILLTTALPAFNQLVIEFQVKTLTAELQGSLSAARHEAVRRQAYVVVASSTTWAQGWQIFEDRNRNGVLDSNEVLIKSFSRRVPQVLIKANNSTKGYVGFSAEGRAEQISGAFLSKSFSICSTSTMKATRKLVLSAGGRVRLELPKEAYIC